KPGDIGTAVDFEGIHRLCGGAIQGQHRGSGSGHVDLLSKSALECSSYDSSPQRFSQNNDISGLCVGVCTKSPGMHRASHRVAELDVIVGDGVTAEQGAIRFLNLFDSPCKDCAERFQVSFAR